MTTPVPYVVTQDDVQALIRVMENAGRPTNASWFDVAHRVLQGLHSRGIVNYSMPRLTPEQVVTENQRLELQVQGLQAQLTSKTSELATVQQSLTTCATGLTTCQGDLALCQQQVGQQ